jgi:peptide/nickel transport system permease protein
MKRLLKYAVIRILLTIPMLLILLTLAFFILRVMPGDPVKAMLGAHAPPDVIEQKRVDLGLDKPMIAQYFDYLEDLVRFDLGKSMIYDQRVSQPIIEKLPATLELIIIGMALTIALGIPLGAFAASKRRTSGDMGIRMYGIIVFCIPVYWMGMMLQLIFGVWLGWLPVAGRTGGRVFSSDFDNTGFYLLDTLMAGNWTAFLDVAHHLVLPAFTLGIVLSGVFVRMTRANMLDVLKSDYVLAAQARGISDRKVVYSHALKNAFIPILTMLGLQFALLLGNALLTETTFSWPGMARLLIDRIYLRDYPTVQGCIVVIALMVSLISLIVDIVYAIIDPRVKY